MKPLCEHIIGLFCESNGDFQPVTESILDTLPNSYPKRSVLPFLFCPNCGKDLRTTFCPSCGRSFPLVVDGMCFECRNDLEQTKKPLPPPEMYEYPCPFCPENLSVYPMQKDGRINLYYLKCENAECFDSLSQPSAAFIGIVCKTPPDGLRHLRYSKMNLPK